jgi:hypothetical protein
MLYREIIAVCSEIRTKHINTLCGQNVELCVRNTWKVLKCGAGDGRRGSVGPIV